MNSWTRPVCRATLGQTIRVFVVIPSAIAEIAMVVYCWWSA